LKEAKTVAFQLRSPPAVEAKIPYLNNLLLYRRNR